LLYRVGLGNVPDNEKERPALAIQGFIEIG